MGIHFSREIKPSTGYYVAVVSVNFSIDYLLEHVDMCDDERIRFENITHENRKREFLGTSFAIKQLLGKEPYLLRDGNGKPHFQNLAIELSLSHCGQSLALIMHPYHDVGIDLQEVNNKVLLVAKKFLNDEELAKVGTDREKATLYWSAKEALYKYYSRRQLSLKNDLQIVEKEEGRFIGVISNESHYEEVPLNWEWIGNFALVYTVKS
jgi:4'-phosphopantetheinyl transferase EntD